MIYFIITTCIFNDCLRRQSQYINGINKLNQVIKNLNFDNYKVIIVENNGIRNTYLDELGCEVYYTTNNISQPFEKGYKELSDVLDCIEKYKINDTDFIVKMTGRYVLNDDSEFMNIVKDIHNTKYECVIRYGYYETPVNYKTDDCITGLIGMTCRYVKQIEKPNNDECVEWKWAKVTNLIDNDKIYLVNKLGINICPGCSEYFMV